MPLRRLICTCSLSLSSRESSAPPTRELHLRRRKPAPFVFSGDAAADSIFRRPLKTNVSAEITPLRLSTDRAKREEQREVWRFASDRQRLHRFTLENGRRVPETPDEGVFSSRHRIPTHSISSSVIPCNNNNTQVARRRGRKYIKYRSSGDSPHSTEYRHTLFNLSQEKIRHCASLPPSERLACELEGAIDAQGHPATNAKNTNPPQPPPAAKESCKFREDNIYSLYPHSMPQCSVLNRVLEKYVAMHRRCRDIDFAVLDDVYTSSRRPTCQYLIWRPSGYGFGNRLLALISSFLYAIMSARVLLIDYPEWDHLFCEPFLGSSIQLPAQTKLNHVLGDWYIQFRDARCGFDSSNKICNTTMVNLRLNHKTGLREYESVACPVGYSRLRNIEFVTMRECNQYLVPGFYLNPVLSPLLEVLFPQRNPFHLLARFLLVPSDAMWASIRSSLDVQASRRVGVQIREFVGRYTEAYDENVIECIKKGGFLSKKFRKRRVHSGEYCSVYTATLVRRHLEAVNSTLKVLVEETGKEFRFNHQRLDGREVHDRKHHAEALVDMWVLSMSNVLVTSQDSTFGYIATGVGGVVPNFLDMEEGKGCFMGLGVEPCFHGAPKNLRCVQDEAAAFSLQEIVDKST